MRRQHRCAGFEALREVRRIARGTFSPSVISDIGSFRRIVSGIVLRNIEKPILVSSTDGRRHQAPASRRR